MFEIEDELFPDLKKQFDHTCYLIDLFGWEGNEMTMKSRDVYTRAKDILAMLSENPSGNSSF